MILKDIVPEDKSSKRRFNSHIDLANRLFNHREEMDKKIMTLRN